MTEFEKNDRTQSIERLDRIIHDRIPQPRGTRDTDRTEKR